MKRLKKAVVFVLAAAMLAGGQKLVTYAGVTLRWPVPGHTALSQGYHDGKAIDISDGSINGATVCAALGGTVSNIWLCGNTHYNAGDCNGFGTGLVIRGDDGRYYQYAHMQAGSIPANVHYGARVEMGQQIGRVGTTGWSTGPHLHFGISLGKYYNESGINPQNETYIYNDVHSHSYSATITKQPDCTQAGVKTFRCSCGASYTETINAKGHNYGQIVVAPTLTDRGYTIHACFDCENSYTDSYVDSPKQSTDGWYYCESLPAGVSSDTCIVEYKNHYEKIQQSAPGAEWTNAGSVRDEWQNSGNTYTSEADLQTSDARLLVRSVYYHFCGPNAGNEGNYDQTGKFVHYDEILAGSVTARYLGTDAGHPYYFINWKDGGSQVWCQSGVSCDGSYGSHGNRCRAWYKLNTYQDRIRIVQYKFTKSSDWTNMRDASAARVQIRFKILETEKPEETGKPEEPSRPVNPGNKEEPERPVIPEEQEEPEDSEDFAYGENDDEQREPSYISDADKKNPRPGKVAGLSVKSRKSRRISIKWRKQNAVAGYQVQLAKDRGFRKGKKTKTAFQREYVWTSGLKKKKTYYIRVRAYNYEKGNRQYGAWSAVKKVRVK